MDISNTSSTLSSNTNEVSPTGALDMSRLQTAEMVEALNTLLANMAIHNQKLKNFHWNVTGGDFFDLHEKFEEQYTYMGKAIDDVAERVRIFGEKPVSTLKDFLDKTEIREAHTDLKQLEMVSEILRDYEILLRSLTSTVLLARNHNDFATEDLLKGFIEKIETNHWMFTSFAARN